MPECLIISIVSVNFDASFSKNFNIIAFGGNDLIQLLIIFLIVSEKKFSLKTFSPYNWRIR